MFKFHPFPREKDPLPASSSAATNLPAEPQAAERVLFQPLQIRPGKPAYVSASVANTPLAAAGQERETYKGDAPPQRNANTSLSAKRLLQGSQHSQRATQFKKIDFGGHVLPTSALRWSCARDTRTALLWETKLFDAGVSDVEHRYSWYDPTRASRGFKNGGSCFGIDCDTYAYAGEMNHLGLCGSRNWRLPTFAELETLLDRDYFNPVINQEIFFNTRAASYWTQSQLENNPKMVMQIDFFNGTSSPAPIHFKLAVRLVSE